MSEVKEISLEDVATHNQVGDLWICIRGYVYDVSKFIHEHPGGEEVLRVFAGKDATEGFEDAAHSEEFNPIMDRLLVARLPSLHQSFVAAETQRPAAVVSSQKSKLEPRQSHVVRKDKRYLGMKYPGLWLAVIGAVKLAMAAPSFVSFVVFGTTVPVALFVYVFIAVTFRHRGAEDYVDYNDWSLKG